MSLFSDANSEQLKQLLTKYGLQHIYCKLITKGYSIPRLSECSENEVEELCGNLDVVLLDRLRFKRSLREIRIPKSVITQNETILLKEINQKLKWLENMINTLSSITDEAKINEKIINDTLDTVINIINNKRKEILIEVEDNYNNKKLQNDAILNCYNELKDISNKSQAVLISNKNNVNFFNQQRYKTILNMINEWKNKYKNMQQIKKININIKDIFNITQNIDNLIQISPQIIHLMDMNNNTKDVKSNNQEQIIIDFQQIETNGAPFKCPFCETVSFKLWTNWKTHWYQLHDSKHFGHFRNIKNNAIKDTDTNDSNYDSLSITSSESEDAIFSHYSFAISGGFLRPHTEIRKLIKDHGGTFYIKPNNKTDFVVVKATKPNLKNTKCQRAVQLKIPIVTVDFLTDCIQNNQLLKFQDYIAESDDANDNNQYDKVMKLNDDDIYIELLISGYIRNETILYVPFELKKFILIFFNRGPMPVDEFCKENDCIVYQENGIVYDAMLNQTNIANNNNKFYKLQILKRTLSDEFFYYFRWARVGYKGQIRCNPGSKSECIQAFKNKFYDKTLNDWDDRNNFMSHAKKYVYLPMDYTGIYNKNNVSDHDENEYDKEMKVNDDDDDMNTKLLISGYVRNETVLYVPFELNKVILMFLTRGPLHVDVQELVQLIFDKHMMEKQMKEIGYSVEKLPLDKIDKSIIIEAYQILKDIESEINDELMNNATIRDYSMRYYTLIPHEFGFRVPPPINTENLLHTEMKLIEALSEIEIAFRLLAGDKQNKKQDEKKLIDKHFDLLKCRIDSISKDDDEFKMIQNYVQLTHAETHNRYKLSVEKVYKLDRDGSNERYSAWSKNKNRMLLWHGTRLTNFVGIISHGLRITPPCAPITGSMFGKGIYFTDMCSKSANYCFTSPINNTGLVLLCEVALGEMNKLLHSDYYASNLPNGTSSTKGCGKTSPDPKTYITLKNGCVVPCGKGIKDNKLKSSYLYNEYIVYDTAQIKMRYLIQLQFDYKNALW